MYLEARMDNLYDEFREFRKEMKEAVDGLKTNSPLEKKHKQTEDACQYLGCSKRWLQNQAKAGKIRKFKVSGKVYYAIEDLDNLITNS